MLNSGVLGVKSKTSVNKLLYLAAFSIAVLFSSLFLTHAPSANAITKSECEQAGGAYKSIYVGGSQGVSSYCDFQYSPVEEIKSYNYFNALSQCARMVQWKNAIAPGDINTPSKWLDSAQISVGYFIDGSDGLQGCNEMITGALKLWGYTSSSYIEFIKAVGYNEQKTTVPCPVTNPGCNTEYHMWTRGGDTLANFQSTIKNRVYRGAAPTLEGRQDLLYLRGQFHLEKANACGATPYKKVADLSDAEKAQFTGKFLTPDGKPGDNLRVVVVNGENWTTEEWVYKIDPGNMQKEIKLNEQPSGGSIQPTCHAIAASMAGYSDRVADDAANMIFNDLDPATKYGDIVYTPGQAGVLNADTDGVSNGSTSCVIDAIGWIVCPVINFLSEIVDAAYGFVSSMLVFQPLLTTGGSEGIYRAWQVMRDIANVAFVIAFLIIIYSQVTGVGISNYGIKKMLPRLIIVAILVNASYWICAIAVDLSNILGASMQPVFASVENGILDGLPKPDFGASGEGWAGITGAILAGAILGGAALYIGLSALIPALIAAALAIVTVFIVLALRQALIILLIVIAPIAFVAYLLPNTQGLFDKWRKLLQTLLLMYPVIAALFGASALASTVIMNSASGDYQIAIQIMGAMVAVLPLALTPLVMRSAGGVLNRIGAVVNNAEKGPVDGLKKRASEYRERRLNIRGANANMGRATFGGGRFRRSAKRDARNAGAKQARTRAEQQYVADQMTDDQGNATNFAHDVAGGGDIRAADPAALQRAITGAKFTIEQAEVEDVKAEHATIDNLPKDNYTDRNGQPADGLKTIALNADGKYSAARVAAATERLIQVGDPDDYEDVVNRYGREIDSEGRAGRASENYEKNATIRKTIQRALTANGPKFIKASNIDMVGTGSMATDGANETFASMAAQNIADGTVSEETMIGLSNGDIRYGYDVAGPVGRSMLETRAGELLANDNLKGSVRHNYSSVTNLSTGTRPSPATAPRPPKPGDRPI